MKIEYFGKCLMVGEDNKRVLVVGDLHLGYEESMNRRGVMIVRKMFDEMISEFDKIFGVIGSVDLVVLLGDVKHDFGSISEQESNDFVKLFNYLSEKSKEIIIIKGNHDNILQPFAKRNNIELKDYFIYNGCCFLHGDKDFEKIYDKNIKIWIMGHGHPAVKLSDGVKVEKFKCFLIGSYKNKNIIILPSFFGLVEGTDPRESDLGFPWKFNLEEFDVKIIGENQKSLDFGKLKNLK